MYKLTELNPSAIWKYFEEISQVPRPSKHEDKIIAYLEQFAFNHQLGLKKDSVGNVLITKQGTKGKENEPVIVLQCHVDMVCEKNAESTHNFLTDPIQLVIDGDWVKAEGTTLGADDGIGLAAMLAILADKNLSHAPLECLFTVDEETGLTGAFELQPGFITGKYLINLDSEDEGEIYIGCAGGIDTTAIFQYASESVEENQKSFLISVTGLQGGHSGDEIHKGLGNAVKIMTSLLSETYHHLDARLNRFDGGHLKNAIPREAFATIILKKENEEAFYPLIKHYTEQCILEYSKTDPGITIRFDEIPTPEDHLPLTLQKNLLSALNECPHGVIAWSKDISGLVETSTNLASIKFVDKKFIKIATSQRSSVDDAKIMLSDQISDVFKSAGAIVEKSKGYPGWTPRMDSPLLEKTSRLYLKLFHQNPAIKAIHAGLECGLFLEKYPDLDMISIGPTLRGVHSPNEKLFIPSVDKFWLLLTELIQ